MSTNKWTKEQQSAITARGGNLLVAAAAGSGKTAVLVERIIQLINDPINPVDVDKLMVVTFTEAAAGEMRERIGKALSDELQKNPSPRLERQLALLNTASFTTLHSFCLELITQYYYLCGLDPAARVADENEADLLRDQALEELLEANYAKSSLEFTQLIDSFGGQRDDKGVRQLILKLAEFAHSNPMPQVWLAEKVAVLRPAEGTKLEDTIWWESLAQLIEFKLQQAKGYLREALRVAELPGGPDVYAVNFAQVLAILEALPPAAITWDGLAAELPGIDWGRLKPCKGADADLKDLAKGYRDKAKRVIEDLINNYCRRSSAAWLEDLSHVAPQMEELVRLTKEYVKRYQSLKHSQGLLDFADLEHYCLAILKGNSEAQVLSPVAQALRQRYSEILVDEYQDINPVQEEILSLVSRQQSAVPNLFMVGDVKQSIYRFRLTEPRLFLAKYAAFADLPGAKNRKIDLAKNFRSRVEVVDGVNFIFRQLMTAKLAEVDYDDRAELVFGAEYYTGNEGATGADTRQLLQPKECLADEAIELHLIEAGNGLEALAQGESEEAAGEQEEVTAQGIEAELEEISSIQREARVVAQRINELIAGKYQAYDKQLGYRTLCYRDIVILMRATSGRANIFFEELRLAGIPAFADLGSGYFAATEVETMLSLLKVIDNPQQDIPLAAVLRSPLVGLNAAQLAQVRLAQPKGDFYQALKSAAASAGELPAKLKEFLTSLAKWRTTARQNSLAELLMEIYRDSGYYDFVTAMPGGAQRQANLKALYDRACQFETANFRGLFRFLRLIEGMQEKGRDLGEARALGENEDVVRIMSIHKSKGLEFPVVFVTGLGKQFNLQDTQSNILLHKDLGFGPQVVDLQEKIKYPSIAKLALSHRMELEMKAEEMRILYVALTRAREKLILVGSKKGIAAQAAKWCRHLQLDKWQLPEYELATARCYLDWLGPAVARHNSATVLRQLAGQDTAVAGPTAGDPAKWEIKLWQEIPAIISESRVDEHKLTKVFELAPVELPGNGDASIKRILAWTYPYEEAVGRQAKFSVTEVKRLHQVWEEEGQGQVQGHYLRPKPDFLLEAKTLSPAERGTAYHLVLQHLELWSNLTPAAIAEQIEQLRAGGLLTEQQAKVVEPQKIAGLFSTVIGARLLKAREILRELPFNLALPAGELYPDLAGTEDKVLLQGVIDCLIKEDDGYVLVDWKTDATSDCAEMERRYQTQLDLYAQAVERILHCPVKEKYIFMLESGAALKLGT